MRSEVTLERAIIEADRKLYSIKNEKKQADH
jgi:hypothetical protein